MNYSITKNTDGKVESFSVNGETKKLKIPISVSAFNSNVRQYIPILLDDDTFWLFNLAGGSAGTTDKSLLEYIIVNNRLVQGTELTDADASIPAAAGSKGFLTGTSQTALVDFYKSFGYNDDNYKLMSSNKNIEISFLCSDRRSGVAGTRRAWSPYFKISALEKNTFTVIQNSLTGTDTTANYNIQAKITRNANNVLFITLTDTHSGTNLYGSVINIRHRVV